MSTLEILHRIWNPQELDSPNTHSRFHDESSHRLLLGTIIIASFFDICRIVTPSCFSTMRTSIDIGTGNLPNVLSGCFVGTVSLWGQLEFLGMFVFVRRHFQDAQCMTMVCAIDNDCVGGSRIGSCQTQCQVVCFLWNRNI